MGLLLFLLGKIHVKIPGRKDNDRIHYIYMGSIFFFNLNESRLIAGKGLGFILFYLEKSMLIYQAGKTMLVYSALMDSIFSTETTVDLLWGKGCHGLVCFT